MRISIITVSYNSKKYIEDCIKSVLNQLYSDIEYIIIDGASSDGTIETIKSYGNQITKFISQPDNGIYDAMNKGIKLASGDIIGMLNSDDIYINDSVITSVVDQFLRSKCDILYGDLYYVQSDNTDKIVRKWETKKYTLGAFKNGWHPAHPSFFVSKTIYEKYGYFDLNYKLAADFELMLRFLEKYHVNSFYLPKPLVKMRLGGATNKNIKNILYQNIECYKAFKKNELDVSILYPFYRIIPKIIQFFK